MRATRSPSSYRVNSLSEKCYPFQAVFEWLSYGDAAYMRQREWSYTKNPDIYLRYRINSSPEEFAADVRSFLLLLTVIIELIAINHKGSEDCA